MAMLTCGCGVGANTVKCRWHATQPEQVTAAACTDTQAAIRRTAQQIDDEIRRGNYCPDALIGDLLFLILGPTEHRVVHPDRHPAHDEPVVVALEGKNRRQLTGQWAEYGLDDGDDADPWA